MVQILMAARSVHRKKKLNPFLNEPFIPIEYFSNIYFYLVIIFLCIFFCSLGNWKMKLSFSATTFNVLTVLS